MDFLHGLDLLSTFVFALVGAREGAQRATKAMLEMKKIDLAAMKKAYLGIHGD
jgi:hypothetical protein